jgi:cupin 2 domain-containing protein
MNIFENLPHIEQNSEYFHTLFQNRNIKIERILSNDLHNGEWYDQKEDEWVLLLEGEAQLEFAESARELKKGDYLFIPAHTRHRVSRTSPDALWLAVHFSDADATHALALSNSE